MSDQQWCPGDSYDVAIVYIYDANGDLIDAGLTKDSVWDHIFPEPKHT